ncbi:unnamed protein product [Miscanthus lutarioriparius]|uniref:Sialate O-acetylesterase domain-containing protein n=1 Tax=Miscanthus lutarioriparius TaxID=422564 RepID=A0A811SG58_9POAL|nr:unnamed protein product [Miscanthus lutarioriparius]
MKPVAQPPLRLLCALAAAAALSILLIAPPALAAHLSSLLLAFPASPYASSPKLVFLLAGQSNIDTHKACGLGLAMPFAHRLLLHAFAATDSDSDLVLGLVPCAVGGTRI